MINNITDFITHNMALSIIFIVLLVIYIIFELFSWFSGGSLAYQLKVSVNQLIFLFNHNKGIIIDIRSAEDYASGHIVGSINIQANLCNYNNAFIKNNSNKPLIVVCESGKAATVIAVNLYNNGAKQAVYLNGGLEAWRALDMPMVSSMALVNNNNANNINNIDNIKNLNNIVIYTKIDCPYSVSAKNLLHQSGLLYKEIVISVDSPEFLNMVKLTKGASNTPQIFINNNHIGDFNALKQFLKK